MRGRGGAPWSTKMTTSALATLFCLMSFAGRAHAWVIAEHTRITQVALEDLWSAKSAEAELLHEGADALGLCVPNVAGGRKCTVLDLVLDVLPALAADHSCTPAQLGAFSIDQSLKLM